MKRYTCKICGETDLFGRIFPQHLKKHNTEPQTYYDKYVNPNAPKNCICGKILKFKKISKGYGNTCSRKCSAKKLLSTMIKNNPNHQSIAGKKGGLKAAGKGIIKVRKSNPLFFEQIMPKIASIALKNLHRFKKNHDNMTPHEWMLWEHPEFKKLNPISQDKRFLTHLIKGQGTTGCIMDFSLPTHRICIEIDGGYHKTKKQRIRDNNRTLFIEKHGWIVLRFKHHEIEHNIDEVVKQIFGAIK